MLLLLLLLRQLLLLGSRVSHGDAAAGGQCRRIMVEYLGYCSDDALHEQDQSS